MDVLGVRAVTSKPRSAPLYGYLSCLLPELKWDFYSFTEILCSPSLICPSSRDRSGTEVDYHKRRNIIYTMATCHSLRVMDGELLGDPLDVKMFQFTGWTFEEGGNAHRSQENGGYDETITPSVAKPPASYNTGGSDNVRTPFLFLTFPVYKIPVLSGANKVVGQAPVELGVLRSFEFVSHLRRTSVIVRQFGDSGVSVFVKGAPECMKDICIPESCQYTQLL